MENSQEKIYSLKDVYKGIVDAISNCEMNHKDPRGASNYDVSGFVKSKKAGERLLRFVKYVLEKDETETWLDYREYEPEWIQFKFSAKEFDVEKLSKLSEANNDIITEEIIRECILKNTDNNAEV